MNIIKEVNSQDLKVEDFRRYQTHYEDEKNQIPGEANYAMNYGLKLYKSGGHRATVDTPKVKDQDSDH